LAREVKRVTGDVIEFRNGSSLEIATNDVRLVRGRSAIAVLGSECCHWRTDEAAASSDEEVVGAAEPSMAMCPDGGLLLLGSSVYRKRGYMFRKWKVLHGADDSEDICWFAPSKTMNPVLPSLVIAKALAEDKAKAGAEYENVWREDLSDFVPLDVIEACTEWDISERPPQPEISYLAFCDAASGTGTDSYALVIAHFDWARGSVVIDVIREFKPRLVPANVIAELAQLLRQYRVSEIWGDRAFHGFHSDEWLRNGAVYRPSVRTTSENYLAALPHLLAGRVRLLDSATARSQFTALERRPMAGGDRIDHPRSMSGHDDVSASISGAIAQLMDSVREESVPTTAPVLVYADGRSSGPTRDQRVPQHYLKQSQPWEPYVGGGGVINTGFWNGLPGWTGRPGERKPW
jgi:hypothetical protein